MGALRRRKRQTLLVPEASQERVIEIVRAQCALQTGF